jgi:hypothetical protein
MSVRICPFVFVLLPLALLGCELDAVHPDREGTLGSERTSWHAGSFRTLPAERDDLVAFVARLPHPNAGEFGRVSPARAARFRALLDAMFEAVELGQADGRLPDWCAVQALAQDAGYELSRFRDTDSGRWLLFGRDTTRFGQAYFFVNPYAKRNLVIEVPHEPYDQNTGVQGARLFKSLAARVLIINKDHRCSDPDPTPCTSGATSACGGFYRESDVSHHTENTFHLLHVWLTDNDPNANFVQLHGFTGSAKDRIEISDTSQGTRDAASVAARFARHLERYVPDPEAVHACQRPGDEPPRRLCGTTNVQGRYTNGRFGDECTAYSRAASGRFLHLEQDRDLRRDDPSTGWWWGQVRDALRDTWPACTLANGARDCTLGPRQADHAGCACGAPCP